MASKEQILLRAFLDSRTVFEKYAPYIIAIKNLERNVKLMLNYIQKFYEKYNSATKIPESELRIYLDSNDLYNFASNNTEYIKSLYTIDMDNEDLTMDVIESACERHFMAEIVDIASLVLESNKSGQLAKVQGIVDQYFGILRNPPTNGIVQYTLDLDTLIQDEIVSTGIPFVNPTATSHIKGMREGQLGLIYAYTDTGKTSYGVANICSVASYLNANKINRPCMYCGNEEQIQRATLRSIQCMTNWTNDEIARNKKSVDSIIKKHGFNKILWFDQVNDTSKIEKLLIDHNPRVMFIDQGTKVNVIGSKKEGVNALEDTFNVYRELAKRYLCTIICMAQGGDACFEKKYPSLRDLYGSKSAIQGELDWAISIGVDTSDVQYADWRYFNITKNKGSKGTYACRFDTKRCQFTEVTP